MPYHTFLFLPDLRWVDLDHFSHFLWGILGSGHHGAQWGEHRQDSQGTCAERRSSNSWIYPLKAWWKIPDPIGTSTTWGIHGESIGNVWCFWGNSDPPRTVIILTIWDRRIGVFTVDEIKSAEVKTYPLHWFLMLDVALGMICWPEMILKLCKKETHIFNMIVARPAFVFHALTWSLVIFD